MATEILNSCNEDALSTCNVACGEEEESDCGCKSASDYNDAIILLVKAHDVALIEVLEMF